MLKELRNLMFVVSIASMIGIGFRLFTVTAYDWANHGRPKRN